MLRKKCLITLFFLLALTLINCEKDTPRCPPFLGDYFRISGISQFSHQYWAGDTTLQILQDNSKLDFENYNGLILNYSVDYYGYNKMQPSISFGQLYALSCRSSGLLGSKEKYKDIQIVTLNDFNSDFGKGDTINDLIRIRSYGTIEDFLIENDSNTIKNHNINFYLTQEPTRDSKFKVKIFIEFQNGVAVSKESTTLEFD
ncbi:MAG: hypothetical protein ACI9YL_000500 [Luteibaculaceae bacterium]|jgi:hypothetical protein